MKNILENKKGVALLLTLIVMMFLFIFGAAYLTSMISETGIARNQENSEKAFFIAEAGLERAIKLFVDDSSWRTASLVENLGEGSYTLVVEDDPVLSGVVRMISTGQVGASKRILQVRISSGGGLIHAVCAADTTDVGVVDLNLSGASGTIDGDAHANGSASTGSVTITGTLTQGDLGDDLVDPYTIDMDFYKTQATTIYTGDVTINSRQGSELIYVQAGGGTPGIATIDCSGKIKVKFVQSSLIAEGGIIISGATGLQFDEYDHPQYGKLVSLGTKTGDITESGSSSAIDRDFKGVIFTEQGDVTFENIRMQGAIYGQNVRISENVEITFKAIRVPGPSGGVVGGVAFFQWQENSY